MPRSCWLLFLISLFISPAFARNEPTALVVFQSPACVPVTQALEKEIQSSLGVPVRTEVKGSQALCRRLTEAGQACDVLWLADAALFKDSAAPQVSWRIEFAHDEMVLAVGSRARLADPAEKDWVTVLLRPEIRLGRVDENLGSLGYRTLLVWALREQAGTPGLSTALKSKATRLASQGDQLAADLRGGQVDYAFLYKTTCQQHHLRFIPLDPALNLGSLDRDYNRVSARYQKKKSGREWTVTVSGAPITYGVSIPRRSAQPEKARRYLAFVLHENSAHLAEQGYQVFKPRFYGTRSAYEPFSAWCDYGGGF
jgi:molybdate/tungstate transport system substrate-binding protein